MLLQFREVAVSECLKLHRVNGFRGVYLFHLFQRKGPGKQGFFLLGQASAVRNHPGNLLKWDSQRLHIAHLIGVQQRQDRIQKNPAQDQHREHRGYELPLTSPQSKQHNQCRDKESVPAVGAKQRQAHGPGNHYSVVPPSVFSHMPDQPVQRRDKQQHRPAEGNVLPEGNAVNDVVVRKDIQQSRRQNPAFGNPGLIKRHDRKPEAGRHKQDLHKMEKGDSSGIIVKQQVSQPEQRAKGNRMPKRHNVVIVMLHNLPDGRDRIHRNDSGVLGEEEKHGIHQHDSQKYPQEHASRVGWAILRASINRQPFRQARQDVPAQHKPAQKGKPGIGQGKQRRNRLKKRVIRQYNGQAEKRGAHRCPHAVPAGNPCASYRVVHHRQNTGQRAEHIHAVIGIRFPEICQPGINQEHRKQCTKYEPILCFHAAHHFSLNCLHIRPTGKNAVKTGWTGPHPERTGLHRRSAPAPGWLRGHPSPGRLRRRPAKKDSPPARRISSSAS